MSMFKRLYLAAGLAGLMLATAFAARAAENSLNYIPKEADVIVSVNIRAIVDSGIFKKIKELHPESQAQLEMVKNLLGVDLTKDMNRITVFGRMNNKQVGGFIVKGKFDQEKLLTMIKANPQYKTAEVGGITVHQWWEEKEKRVKYGAFLPGDMAVVWNNEETAKASLAAAKDAALSFAGSPEAALIPASAENAIAGVLAVNREKQGPAAKYHLSAVMAVLNLTEDEVSVSLTVTPDSGELVSKFADIFRGLAAFGQLQPDNKAIAYVAGRTKVETSDKSVTLTTSVEKSKVDELIAKKTGKLQ